MPESAFTGTVLEGQKRRYTIINEKDVEKYVPQEVQDAFVLAFDHMCLYIEQGREKDGKKPYNSYVVNNTDEPYIKEIVEVMQKHGKWDGPKNE